MNRLNADTMQTNRRRCIKIDGRELSRHYASLTDEELLSLDCIELTDTARVSYDQEVASLGLNAILSIGADIEVSNTDFEGTHKLPDGGMKNPSGRMTACAPVNLRQHPPILQMKFGRWLLIPK
jgi:hypothetical protein